MSSAFSTSRFAAHIAVEGTLVESDPLGSGSLSLALKYWRSDIELESDPLGLESPSLALKYWRNDIEFSRLPLARAQGPQGQST